jgi:hypothetical protein
MDLMIMVQSNKVRSLMRELRQEIENAEQYYDDLSGCPELRERAFFNFVNVSGPINGWPDPVNVLMSRVDPGHDHQQELDEAERIAKDVVRDVAAALTGCEIEFGNKISSAFHSYGPDYEVLAEEYEERVNNRNNW